MVEKMSLFAYWVPGGLEGGYEHIRRTHCLHLHFSPEDGDSTVL
jgi:hypothetical protein